MVEAQPWKSLTYPWSSPRQPQQVYDLEVPHAAKSSSILKASMTPQQCACNLEVPYAAMLLLIHKASTNLQQPSSRSAMQPLMSQTHMQHVQDPQGQWTGHRTHQTTRLRVGRWLMKNVKCTSMSMMKPVMWRCLKMRPPPQ